MDLFAVAELVKECALKRKLDHQAIIGHRLSVSGYVQPQLISLAHGYQAKGYSVEMLL